jgi:DNA repair ATPase RecN
LAFFFSPQTDPQYLLNLEKEKQSLISQLRDYEWRLEQENKVNEALLKLIKSFIYSQLSSLKAYHKANEERKDLHQEITDVRNSINAIKEKQDLLNIQTQAITAANNPSLNVNTNNGTTSRTNFSRLSNSDYYYRLELTQILFFFSFFFLYIFV